MDFPQRKLPVHLPIHRRFNHSTIIFVTVCSASRKPIFHRSKAVELICAAWQKAPDWQVGRYVVMPDHIHWFTAPGRFDPPALKRWIQYWKALVSRQWPWPQEHPIWQKSFWDTQLRRGDSYEAKWKYVEQNPVRAGLCRSPSEWPFQGELTQFHWHE